MSYNDTKSFLKALDYISGLHSGAADSIQGHYDADQDKAVIGTD